VCGFLYFYSYVGRWGGGGGEGGGCARLGCVRVLCVVDLCGCCFDLLRCCLDPPWPVSGLSLFSPPLFPLGGPWMRLLSFEDNAELA